MKSRSLVLSALDGQDIPRVPRFFWQNPVKGNDATNNALDTYNFYKTWKTDIIKAQNTPGYLASALICAEKKHIPPEDVSIYDSILSHELSYLNHLLESVRGDVPVLFTIESPLSVFYRISDWYIEEYGTWTTSHMRLMVPLITDISCALTQRAIEMGADGIFLETAIPENDFDYDEELYQEYLLPHDIAVLSSSSGWCNAVCARGKNVFFPYLRKYPAQILLWNQDNPLPSPVFARDISGKCIGGGISPAAISSRKYNHIENGIYTILREMGEKKVILSPGSPLPRNLPDSMPAFLDHSIREIDEMVRRKYIPHKKHWHRRK